MAVTGKLGASVGILVGDGVGPGDGNSVGFGVIRSTKSQISK